MVVERQLSEAFFNIKPHVEAISKALKAYDMPTTFMTFFSDRVDMSVVNDLSLQENQVLSLTYTPPVEEVVRIDQQRIAKE